MESTSVYDENYVDYVKDYMNFATSLEEALYNFLTVIKKTIEAGYFSGETAETFQKFLDLTSESLSDNLTLICQQLETELGKFQDEIETEDRKFCGV